MDFQNPFYVSILSGIVVYFVYNNNSKQSNKTKNKEIKQMKLNYAFLTTIIVYCCMQYYTSNDTHTIEPTLRTKFED